MDGFITYENLRSFAYVNDAICRRPIRGIVLSFFGLGGMTMYDTDPVEGEFYAEKGILYVVPYNNPWAWMNEQAVRCTDAIVEVLLDRYAPGQDLPIVSTGGSMGGQSALVYMVYSKRTPAACVANCPVCDVVFHFTERPDLPRTLCSALFHHAGSLEDALRSISPLHLIDRMPHADYHIFHCTKDEAVNMQAHSDRFVAAMRSAGHSITYDAVPDRGHCRLTLEMQKKFAQYCVDCIEKHAQN